MHCAEAMVISGHYGTRKNDINFSSTKSLVPATTSIRNTWSGREPEESRDAVSDTSSVHKIWVDI